MQRYNDSTQKAHEGLTEDNNKQIRSVLVNQGNAEETSEVRHTELKIDRHNITYDQSGET